MSTSRAALVIGGGIAGPVVATALHKAGIEASVCEAYPGPSDGLGGTLALATNGLAALRVIGADDAVRDVGFPITRTRTSIGGTALEMPSVAGVEPQRMVGRGDLQRVLHDHAVAAGVTFGYGRRLVGVDEHADGVTARFADGSSATADVLIGADGVRSTVRTLIDPDAPGPGYTGLLGFEGSAPPGTDLGVDPEPGAMTFAFGRRAYYLYWTRPDGRIAWGANLPSNTYLSLTEARSVPAEDWLHTLRATYRSDVPGAALAQHTTADGLEVSGALHIMPPVPHWHRGRMVLVGDAVHAPSNSTGQGASLAIESAIELARCLRDLPDPHAAFTAYEGLRRRRVEKITKRGARTNRAKTPGPVGRTLTRLMMPLFFRFANLEKMMGPELRHTIDWHARVPPAQAMTGARA